MNEQHHREVRMAALSPLMEEILAQGGSVELTVTGNSMWPMLRHRVSRVRLAPAGELKKGDLPLYRRANGHYVLHRVAEIENGCYTCCGDNQWHLEHGIRQDQIIAVMTDFARGDRWISGESGPYRCYWHLWLWIRPLRRVVFGGMRRVKRILSRLGR